MISVKKKKNVIEIIWKLLIVHTWRDSLFTDHMSIWNSDGWFIVEDGKGGEIIRERAKREGAGREREGL